MPVIVKTLADLRAAEIFGRIKAIWGTATVIYAWVYTADFSATEMWSVMP